MSEGEEKGKEKGEEIRPAAHPKSANVINYAKALIQRYGPFVCIEREWRQWVTNDWGGGIWQTVSSDEFLSYALAIQVEPQHPKMAASIIETVRQLTQAKQHRQIKWRGAIGFKHEKMVIVNTHNGIIKLDLGRKEVSREDADPSHKAVVQLPIIYDRNAKCPIFREEILGRTLPDPANQLCLQCYLGYCLLPDFRHQRVLYCCGKPSTGKSLLIQHCFSQVFGPELMSAVTLEAICKGGDELRCLETSLVNIGNEINQTALKETAVFNKIADGDYFDAALKYDKARRIWPTCKHIFIGNFPPHWLRGSEAQARRVLMLNFEQVFDPIKANRTLRNKIIGEESGIFNWIIEGLFKLIELGDLPKGGADSIRLQESFRENIDPMKTFVESCCRLDPSLKTSTQEFTRAYEHWAESRDIYIGAMAPVAVLRGLYGKDVIGRKQRRIDGKRIWHITGIGLKLETAWDNV
jgi:P4 family phage/plasmid primase-like protien